MIKPEEEPCCPNCGSGTDYPSEMFLGIQLPNGNCAYGNKYRCGSVEGDPIRTSCAEIKGLRECIAERDKLIDDYHKLTTMALGVATDAQQEFSYQLHNENLRAEEREGYQKPYNEASDLFDYAWNMSRRVASLRKDKA